MTAELVSRLRAKAAVGGFIPIHDMTIEEAADEIERLSAEVNRLMGLMPEHDTRESYRCTECGAFHLRPASTR